MKTPRYQLALVLLFAGVSTSMAGELARGPEITASDVADQLGIFTTSLVYKQAKPFSKFTVGLVYKEKDATGELKVKADILSTIYSIPRTTEQPIKVLIDKNASTIITGSSASHGEGLDLPSPSSRRTPPEILADGNFALITLLNDARKSDTAENVKGILELVVKAGD